MNDRAGTGRARSTTVTEEPFGIAPDLLGRPLSTIRRRAVAFAIDGVLAFIVSVPILLLAAVGSLWLQAPATFAGGVGAMFGRGELTDAQMDAYQLDVYRLVHNRRPDLLPRALAEAVEAGDADRLARLMDEREINLLFTLDTDVPSRFNAETDTIELHGDVLFGPFASVFSLLSVAILYYTVAGIRGRPPGKWATGIRVVRLDGKPMTLWASFQRAGGYGASFGTLGLGFFAAVKDPNRQAVHDRICSTVVLRQPRPARIRAAVARLRDWLSRAVATD